MELVPRKSSTYRPPSSVRENKHRPAKRAAPPTDDERPAKRVTRSTRERTAPSRPVLDGFPAPPPYFYPVEPNKHTPGLRVAGIPSPDAITLQDLPSEAELLQVINVSLSLSFYPSLSKSLFFSVPLPLFQLLQPGRRLLRVPRLGASLQDLRGTTPAPVYVYVHL